MSNESVVLGISTHGQVEVALASAGKEFAAASGRSALESLLSLLRSTLSQADAKIEDVSLIGVSVGPGSFTGLRIGVAFAKSLAQTRGLPIVGISTYDIAAFPTQVFPTIAVARGKPGHYYARITVAPGAEPTYISGSRVTIEQAAVEFGGSVPASIVGSDFSFSGPGDAALAVAKLARPALERAGGGHWTKIAIDYGQRPNAVLNWEAQRAARAGGPPLSRREQSTQ
jgi:tRNA threonylcarbamoyl adenosine modification protein YeaZ